MKKLMSSLMIGLIAATATMSTMAAPAQDHRNPPPPAKMDQKPIPPKADMRKDAPKPQINKKSDHGKFDQKAPKPDFNKKSNKNMPKQGKQPNHTPDRKAPPMPAHR